METILLEVHLCQQRRSIFVTFPEGTDAVAADYVKARFSYAACAVVDSEGNEVWYDSDIWPLLRGVLDPTCEHGLSANLCYGPDHYMSRDQELSMGWDYNDYERELFSPAED